MRWRTVIIAAAVVAVIAASIAGQGGNKSSSGSGSTSTQPDLGKAPAGALHVKFLYSPEKEALILPVIKRFNASGTRAGGRRVFVDAQNVSSGDAETKMAKGRLKPVAWSPPSTTRPGASARAGRPPTSKSRR